MKKKISSTKRAEEMAAMRTKNMYKNRGELWHVRTMDMDRLVDEYLMLGEVRYAMRINGYDALEKLGYSRPKYDQAAKSEFDAKVHQFANILKRTLIELGFKADKREKSHSVQNTHTKHVKGCTVYTNLPSAVFYKAMEAAIKAEETMKIVHDKGIEMNEYERFRPAPYRSGQVVLSSKMNSGVKLVKNNEGLRDAFAKFVEVHEPTEQDEFEYFKTRSTDKYKNFLRGEEKGAA